jgi:hypothetical protein
MAKVLKGSFEPSHRALEMRHDDQNTGTDDVDRDSEQEGYQGPGARHIAPIGATKMLR